MEVTYALGAEMLVLVGARPTSVLHGGGLEDRCRRGRRSSGRPEWSRPRAANPAVWTIPACCRRRRPSRSTGHVRWCSGGGRAPAHRPGHHQSRRRPPNVDDIVDPSVGFVITVKPGESVKAGEPIASNLAKTPPGNRERRGRVARGDRESARPAGLPPLISHRVTARGVETLGVKADALRDGPVGVLLVAGTVLATSCLAAAQCAANPGPRLHEKDPSIDHEELEAAEREVRELKRATGPTRKRWEMIGARARRADRGHR